MKRRNQGQRGVAAVLALWLAFGICATSWIVAQRAVDRQRDHWPEAYPLLFLPSGRYLKAASLGYHVLLADTIYLWSIQYYGHRRTQEGRNYLWHIYNTITDLDPQFIDAYLVGALVMAVDMADVELALRLLEKGARENPDEWMLPLEAGFYCFINLNDYDRASVYFERTLAISGAPAVVARLRAHMYEMKGQLLTSLQFWLEVRAGAEEERVIEIADQHIYDLRVQIDIRVIEHAVHRYREDVGGWPPSLTSLADAGYLTHSSVNPEGSPYDYDAETGEVTDPGATQPRGGRN